MVKLPGTPIFMYHAMARSIAEIPPDPASPFCVLAAQFNSQLEAATNLGFSTITLEDFQSGGGGTRSRVALLTFDDGSASDYEIAFPLLQKLRQRAIFFLNSSTVGKPGYLTWSQIRDMQQAGMSFQSHGHEHHDFRALPRQELVRQLETSKHILEDNLGNAVKFFAAPHGLLSPVVVEQALELGYLGVCGTRSLPAHREDKIYGRVAIYQHTQLAEFRGLLTCHPMAYGKRVAAYAAFRARRLLRVVAH